MSRTSDALAIAAVVTFVVLMKVVICNCLLRLRARREDDTIPILEDNLVERLQEIHETRRRARRAREPPPTFEDALANSRPVSYIDKEEPPPTYDEYLSSSGVSSKSTSSSDTSNNNSPVKENAYLDFSPSVNPSDILIPMQVGGITVDERAENEFRIESNA